MDETLQNYLSESQQKNVEQKPQNGDIAPEKAPAKPAPKPYPVFGTDITILEGDFIEFYKARMKIMAIKFKLVGQVNNKGEYVINEDIRRDLVRMEKEIEDSGETFYKAIALYMRKYFYFHVKIEQQENGMAKATLYLSEFVDGFLGQDYIVTPVAEYTSINDDEFRIRVRRAFHLVDVEVKNDDMAVPDLAVIMQDALDMELLLCGFFDMASQVYLMKMLKALEESNNETCLRVLERYHQLLALQNLDLNDKYKYIKYKALLDNAIDEVGGLEKLGLGVDVLKPIVNEYNKITQIITTARKGILEMDTAVKPEELLKTAPTINNRPAPKKTAGIPKPAVQPVKKPVNQPKNIVKKPEEKRPSSSWTPAPEPKPKPADRTAGRGKLEPTPAPSPEPPKEPNRVIGGTPENSNADKEPKPPMSTNPPPAASTEEDRFVDLTDGSGSAEEEDLGRDMMETEDMEKDDDMVDLYTNDEPERKIDEEAGLENGA